MSTGTANFIAGGLASNVYWWTALRELLGSFMPGIKTDGSDGQCKEQNHESVSVDMHRGGTDLSRQSPESQV